MKVEPVLAYRRLKYPRIGEEIMPVNSKLPKALIAAALVLSSSQAYAGAAGRHERRPPMSEQEIVQILKYEAEKYSIAFNSEQNPKIKWIDSDIEIALNLYNEEKQIGAAVIPDDQVNKISNTLSSFDKDFIRTRGLAFRSKREDEPDVNFFITAEIDHYYEEDLRQAFREFLEWLQSEGII